MKNLMMSEKLECKIIKIEKITDISQHINGLKAVLFDLDDTLYSEKEYVRSGYRAAAMTLLHVADAERKLWKAFEKKKSAFDIVLKEEGIYTEELKQKCLNAYRCCKPDIYLYEGVDEILWQLREVGLVTGIITDGRPEGQWAKIEALRLKNMVDHIIVTDDLGSIKYRKPCDRAFRLMKEYFNVGYNEMCYVGDNVRKDFVAPEKLGIRSIWFRNRDGLYN